MSVAIAASTDIVVPLNLTIEQEGVGGVTGLTGGSAPTVRLRDGATLNSYADFGDAFNFKVAGFSQQDQPLSEVGNGQYSYALDLNLITSLAIGNILVAEYKVNDGGDVVGVAADIIVIGTSTLASFATDFSILRKSITNRMEEFPGNPGTLILWDDDSVTPLLTWELRDAAGNGVIATVGCPAKRTKAV